MKSIKIEHHGFIEWRNENDVLHREDGPALLYDQGDQEWYFNGKLHRNDGPAVYDSRYQYKAWYQHGIRHREDGPAIERLRHHLDKQLWYYHGEKINCSSQKEFERLIKLKAFW